MVYLKTALVAAVLAFLIVSSSAEEAEKVKIKVTCALPNVTVKYTPEPNLSGKFYFENSTNPECLKEFSNGTEEVLITDFKTCVTGETKNFSIIIEYVDGSNVTKKARGNGTCQLKRIETLAFHKGLVIKESVTDDNQTVIEEEIEMIPIEVTSESGLQGDLKIIGTEEKEVEEVSMGEKVKLEISISGTPETLAEYKKMIVESCVISSASNDSAKIEINYGCDSTSADIPKWTQENNTFVSEYTAKPFGDDRNITIDCSIKACIDPEDCPDPECPKAETRKRRDVNDDLLIDNYYYLDDSKFEKINVNSLALTISKN
ncbi:uncharacterized protein LOC130666082 [Microplitis mediator]|uniref:uncharacterized protein LOC130666082 n=1 Tax=Microplitis mediator TaxID=375433 RepID=UPI002556ED82|nr:uncharacterized protein LOC130666082 [Microplitis mediator]